MGSSLVGGAGAHSMLGSEKKRCKRMEATCTLHFRHAVEIEVAQCKGRCTSVSIGVRTTTEGMPDVAGGDVVLDFVVGEHAHRFHDVLARAQHLQRLLQYGLCLGALGGQVARVRVHQHGLLQQPSAGCIVNV